MTLKIPSAIRVVYPQNTDDIIIDLLKTYDVARIDAVIKLEDGTITCDPDALTFYAGQDPNPGQIMEPIEKTGAGWCAWIAIDMSVVVPARYVRVSTGTGKLYTVRVFRGYDDAAVPVPGAPTPIPGPQIQDCAFPAFTPNLWVYFGALFGWLGCIVKNIIIIVQWIADWLLNFPAHLDAWISNLFGIDPTLPFFDELMRKIDIWISNRFGIDPALPFFDELIKKTFAWLFGAMDAASRERLKRM